MCSWSAVSKANEVSPHTHTHIRPSGATVGCVNILNSARRKFSLQANHPSSHEVAVKS